MSSVVKKVVNLVATDPIVAQQASDAAESGETESQSNASTEMQVAKESSPDPVEVCADANNNQKDFYAQRWTKKVLLPNFTLGQNAKPIRLEMPKGVGQIAWTDIHDWGRIEKESEGWCLIPEKPGDWTFWANFRDGSSYRFDVTVNPDPWSLWRVNQPSERVFCSDVDRVSSDHKDVIKEDFFGFQVIGASRRGRSHEQSGTYRDDDMGYWADVSSGCCCLMVSDGAGSCRYSREGARLAIQYVKEKLPTYLTPTAWDADGPDLRKDGKIGKTLAALAHYGYTRLKAFVAKREGLDLDSKDVGQQKAILGKLKDFSATLLIAVLKRDADGTARLVTFSVGDGAIAWYTGAGFGLMCRPDSGEFGGGTRFLTTPEVWDGKLCKGPSGISLRDALRATSDMEERGRIGAQIWSQIYEDRVFCRKFSAEEAKRLSLFLMTDGVSDPWFETDAGLENFEKWRSFVEDTLKGSDTDNNEAGLSSSDSAAMNAQKLLDWLYFRIPGNHDDRTMLAMLPTDKTDMTK